MGVFKDNAVSEEWVRQMVRCRYWRQWSIHFYKKADIHHRGTLLLLVGGMSKTKEDVPEDADRQGFRLAEAYFAQGLPGLEDLVVALNPLALQLYETGHLVA